MAMEPPPKRRRKGQSPLDQEEEEEEDDDELSFQPFEIEAKRDPGYKFSVERAYADQRFQATMAHIFDKYSRDFEGIGDEIDLMTGEIVVNNGHVHNMRNEGDVGDDLVEEEEDDDDGILLEDLLDEDEEEERDAEAGREEDRGEDGTDEEEEEDRIMQGREPSHLSTALVPRSGFFPGRPGSASLGFWPPPLPFGSSPFAFGRSPLAEGPWGLPDQFSDPLWDHPNFAVARRPPTQRLGLTPGRYNFPVQDGQSSIWAPRSKFKDDGDEPLRSAFTAAFGKHLARKRTKPRKSILPPPVRKSADDDEDEEAILTGKAPGKPPDSRVIDATDDDDEDVLLSGRRSSSKPQNSGGREAEKDAGGGVEKVTQSTRRGRKRKRRPTEDPTHERGSAEETSRSQPGAQSQQSEADALKARSPEEDSQGAGDRRRSGRPRKQVEFLNKISWAEVLEERKSQKMTIVLPSIDPQSREGYKLVDGDVNEEVQSTSSNNESNRSEAKDHNNPVQSGDRIILDSQNTSSSTHDGHASQRDGQDMRPGNSKHRDADSAYVLSDDEAPTLLSKSRSTRGGNKPQNPEVQAHRTMEDSTVEPTTRLEEADEQVHQEEAEDSSALQQADGAALEAPELSLDDNTQPSDQTTGVVDDQPVKPRRPRKQTSKSNLATDKYAVNEADIEPEETTRLPLEDPSGAVPMSSSPTRALTRITAEVSLDDKPPRRLGREVRWLRRRTAAILSSSPTARDGVGSSPEMNGSVRRRGRPRKSAAVVEQPAAPTEARQDEQGGGGGGGADTMAVSPVLEEGSYEAAEEEPQVDAALPSPRRTASPMQAQKETPRLSPSKPTPPPPPPPPLLLKPTSTTTPSLFPKNPQTPRHANRHRSTKAPSSRRSILSLLSDNDDDDEDKDKDVDELGRNLAAMPRLLSSGAPTTAARRIWKSSALTREVYHTPVKKRPSEPISPGSMVKTPGGTVRACGRNGYRCGRDFCFTCL